MSQIKSNNPLELINEQLPSLSRTRKKIANYIIRNSESVCFMSLDKLSEATTVTPMTIIKFCKELGYNGYVEFKYDLQKYVKSIVTYNNAIRNEVDQESTVSNEKHFTELINSELNLMKYMLSNIDKNEINNFVDILDHSSRVYIICAGASVGIADYTASRLKLLHIDAKIWDLTNKKITLIDFSFVKNTDTFLVFSFPNYSTEIINALRSASLLNNTIIGITDKSESVIAPYTNNILTCRVNSIVFTNSMTPVLSMVTILLSLLAIKRKASVRQIHGDLNEKIKLEPFMY